MPESILVTGAGGFIVRQLVRALADRGDYVLAASRSSVVFPSQKVETIVGELQEPADFLPLITRSRAVVHLAARSTPGSTAGNPLAKLHANLHPTLATLQAMQPFPQKQLICLSSGGSLYATTDTKSTDEQSRISPRSYHGAGKAAVEHFISAWCSQHGTSATIVRPSNIYGPGQTERAGFAVIPTALGAILRDETMTVWGDGSAIRDYLFVEDFIALCLSMLDAPPEAGVRTINASSGVGVSLDSLFAGIEAATGRSLRRAYEGRRSVDAPRVAMDSSTARMKFGWSATTSLHEGLKRTWNWLITTRR